MDAAGDFTMDYKTIRVEQDPKCVTRFRITLREDEVATFNVSTTAGPIREHERVLRSVKRALGNEAVRMLASHPAREWARLHGGFTKFCSITYRPTGEIMYRAGLSITFYDRRRAALFKLSHVGR
jgi:hypothetical protein